ncbi:transketolase [Acetobacteraceae bacterium]|nr:transketolase [Acetobacteraceae bacterium]
MQDKVRNDPIHDIHGAEKAIAALRILSAESVYHAGSGHLGAPLGLAPALYALWAHEILYDPTNPLWEGRDRFILSGGHGSVLYYVLMHLAAFRDSKGQAYLTSEQLRKLRKLGSLTPAHPEYGHTLGVEMTTGPLGQGCASSVGMAAGVKWLQASYPDSNLFEQRIFTFCGDGDLMEGISAEAASLAGHWGLGNLVWIYDNNKVSIEGKTTLAFSEDVTARFKAYGWHIETVEDGEDWQAVLQALKKTRGRDRPTFIDLHTCIGRGLLNREGTERAHGGTLTKEELQTLYRLNNWHGKDFLAADQDVFAHFAETLGLRGQKAHEAWQRKFQIFKKDNPEKALCLENIFKGKLPQNWDQCLEEILSEKGSVSTRISSGKILSAIAETVPFLLGGAGDVGPSTFTLLANEKDFGGKEGFSFTGRNFHFGVREAGMGAIANGIALIGLRPFVGTFLAFFDYIHPAIRLSAMMKLPVIYVFTLDSIKVGEDGPTHQPVEQLAQLRSIPGLTVIRPADECETQQAWHFAMEAKRTPIALIFSRQSVPQLTASHIADYPVSKGAYILKEACHENGLPECILMASGSEVALAEEVWKKLILSDVKARLVSFPSFECFEQQSEAYKEKILPSSVRARIAVELGVSQPWGKYLGLEGGMLSVEDFGESGDGEILARSRGFTEENLLDLVRKVLLRCQNKIE